MNAKEFFEQHDRIVFKIVKKLGGKMRQGIDPSLTQSHIYLLMFIKNEGTCTVSDIANYLGITLSAVTGLTNRLFNMKLVTRLRSDADRRNVIIGLTDEGRDVLEKIDENRKKIFEDYYCCLDEIELKTYIRILNKLASNILNENKNKMA